MPEPPLRTLTSASPGSPKLKRDIWLMSNGRWGAEVSRNGAGVGLRDVSLRRAVWHLLTVRRPDEWLILPPSEGRRP